ncbi:hypothetical protein FA13DRAFT_1292947 [Coprinellus micaceus]|uniref:Uncharacterized protein n=1 Tax=Coprinellus micaceus TaxID=71717 RepID=A0A4Y7SSU2_COPMI|nr:hypothetical protein FA13DRAFT_1292947 [Coprinellus micaceus]
MPFSVSRPTYVKEPPSTHHVLTVSHLLMIVIDSDRNRILPRKADKGHPTCTHGAVARLRQLEANGYHEICQIGATP